MEEERESTALQLCLNVKRKIISVAQGSEEAILVLERVCRVLDHSALSLSLFVCPAVSLISASGFKRSVGMSWLVWVWVSVTVLLMCEATFYETIQQHLAPPGTNIQILGESFLLSSSCFIVHSDFSLFNLCGGKGSGMHLSGWAAP
ncbi:hypothetical protein PO909_013830 [Leuciscus waleckii]